MILEKFSHNRKTICYIDLTNGIFTVCTGKPSDSGCLSWTYNNEKTAYKTAQEYFDNYTRKLGA